MNAAINIRVEFSDETTGVGEWMWVCVRSCDDAGRIVFGALDNVPVNGFHKRLRPGSELAISFDQIREHRKATDFDMKIDRGTVGVHDPDDPGYPILLTHI